tara:strand:- start:537 stop:1148 length:612 start_codon:yes stop_codon:yes gene_type:complete
MTSQNTKNSRKNKNVRKTKKSKPDKSKKGIRKTRSKKQGGAKHNKKLWKGVYTNNYKMVEKAINDGADINNQNIDGNTPLIHAIDKEDYYMVEFLLEMGADVTQNELDMAERLTEGEEQNGIPYLLEEEILERNNIRRNANDAFISVANDKVKNSPGKSIAKVLGQYVKYQDKNGDNNKVRPLADKIMRYAGIDKEYIDNNNL